MGTFLRPHPLAFGLCLALVGCTAARIAAIHAVLRDRALAFGVWCAALLVLYSQALSAVAQLHWPGLLMLSGLGASIAILAPGRGRVAVETGKRAETGALSRDEAWLLAALALPIAAYGAGQVRLMLSSFETCGDNLAYHLPRLGYWLQRQSVAPFLSNDPRSGTFPPNGNVLQLLPVLFLRSDRLSAFPQLLAFFGAGGAIAAIARDLGASRLASAVAVSCWFSVPAALSVANVTWVDLVAAFFAVAALAFAVGSVSRPGASAWTCLAAAALAFGTKTQVALIVVPAAAFAVVAAARSGRGLSWRPWVGGIVLVGGLAAVSPIQNLRRFGSPHGYESVAWVVSDPALSTFARNVQLVLSPFNPFLSGPSPEGRVQEWSFLGTLVAPGLGLLWPAAALGSLGYALWRVTRGGGTTRVQQLYVVAAVAGMTATLFTMRHQPSVARFLLPSVAVVTPLIALALEPWLAHGGWRRAVPVVGVAAIGAWVMLVWSVADLKGRASNVAALQFKPYDEMCDSPLRSLARAFDALTSPQGPPRVGVICPQYFQQRFFFGARYSNVVIPLSVATDLDAAALDRLRLDALWFDAALPAIQLFRQPFEAPAGRQPESWRMTSLSSYREGFQRALVEAVEYRSFEELAIRLARRGSGWGVAFADAHGLLFTRQATTQDALALLDVTSPNGVDVRAKTTYTRLGREPLVVTVFAGRSGRIGWEAPFLPRGDRRAWPRRVVVWDAARGRESPAPDGTSLSLPVGPGLNRFLLLPRDADGGPGGRRPLAMGPLRLAWVQ